MEDDKFIMVLIIRRSPELWTIAKFRKNRKEISRNINLQLFCELLDVIAGKRPNDPKLQEYHQEVTKAGERVNLLLSQLDVPLFRIPASEKELDKILIRLKNKPIDPPAVKNQKSKTAAVPPSPPASPRKGKKAGKRSVDSEGFAPPKQLVRKARSPRSSPPPSPTPPSATSVEDARLEGEEEEMDSSQPSELQDQVVVPEVVKKPRIPPFFVSPRETGNN
ncbi:hypothetical protein TNCV_994641 [Trichonephila clavipes]|nr:hypothetical protein TNCV_994641 [Trichonephila clavipes]